MMEREGERRERGREGGREREREERGGERRGEKRERAHLVASEVFLREFETEGILQKILELS
jgi:hypothetical protein